MGRGGYLLSLDPSPSSPTSCPPELSGEDCYNRFTVTGPVDSSVVLQPDLYYPFQHNKYWMYYPSYFSDSTQSNVRHCRDQSYPGSCYTGLLATPDLGPGELATVADHILELLSDLGTWHDTSSRQSSSEQWHGSDVRRVGWLVDWFAGCCGLFSGELWDCGV